MGKSSDVDTLSGLLKPQRRMKKLRRLIDEVDLIRGTGSVGVIFADIYKLKSPHDRYGHAPIDDAIRDLGHVVQSLARENDIACRYGGDEFLLVMPGVTKEETQQKAEQLRQAAAQIRIIYEGQPQEQITLSVGFAHYPSIYYHKSNSKLHRAEALMQAADEDLARDRERNAQKPARQFSTRT